MPQRKYVFSAVLSVIGIFVSPSASAASFSLNLVPAEGSITGSPGATVGWGYSITNSSSSYLVTPSINADLFSNGIPLALFDFPVVAPGATVEEEFVQDAGGLYELTFDSTAIPGANDSGMFDLRGDYYSGDPLTGGVFLDSAGDATAPYFATVSGAQTAVPEPATLANCFLGLACSLQYIIKRRLS